MAKNGGNSLHMLGKWAFLIGFIVAVIFGAVTDGTNPIVLMILAIIGLIVGILNVGHNETTSFLLAGVSLVIVSAFGSDALSAVPHVGEIFSALMVLFVPATVIVAVKHVWSMAKN